MHCCSYTDNIVFLCIHAINLAVLIISKYYIKFNSRVNLALITKLSCHVTIAWLHHCVILCVIFNTYSKISDALSCVYMYIVMYMYVCYVDWNEKGQLYHITLWRGWSGDWECGSTLVWGRWVVMWPSHDSTIDSMLDHMIITWPCRCLHFQSIHKRTSLWHITSKYCFFSSLHNSKISIYVYITNQNNFQLVGRAPEA